MCYRKSLKYIFLNFMCMYLYVCGMGVPVPTQKRNLNSLELKSYSSCELLDVGAGNGTLVLWRAA